MYGKRKYAKKPMARKARKFTKGPRTSVTRLASAVKRLQSMNDGEKKRFTALFSGQLGQTFADGDGAIVLDVTPGCLQGVNTNQRTGASIRLHSTHYQFQIRQQSATKATIRYRMTWLAVKGASYADGTINSQFYANVYNPNPFIGGSIRDANCMYNPDYFGTYQILRTVRGVMAPDQLDSTLMSKSVGVGLKYNKGKGHDIRWNQNLGTAANTFNGQIILVIQVDRGNSSSSTACTLSGVVDTAVNTGLFVQYNKIDYYYDN